MQSAWNDASLTADPKLAVFKAQLDDVKSPPANTAWTQVSAAADSQLERIVKGTGPASALSALQSSANSIGTGNHFLWPLVAAQTQDKYTLPVALALYSTGQNATDYGLLLAGSVLVIAPMVALFMALQRFFVQGVATTGIK